MLYTCQALEQQGIENRFSFPSTFASGNSSLKEKQDDCLR